MFSLLISQHYVAEKERGSRDQDTFLYIHLKFESKKFNVMSMNVSDKNYTEKGMQEVGGGDLVAHFLAKNRHSHLPSAPLPSPWQQIRQQIL